MDPRLFHKRLFDAINGIIPAGAKIVCAVSGGLDSMALLHGLLAVNEIRDRRWNLHVAHLDHRLRSDSAADARFVSDHAAQLHLECTESVRDVASEACSQGESIEQAARRIRYRFLEETANRNGAAFVAAGHHADDQAETILHRLLRGTGLRGLAGMPATRPIHLGSTIQLVRPLLGFTRAELASYGERQGIPFRHDASNDDVAAATRNRIRHDVLPLLREVVNPDVTSALLRLAEQARRADEAILAMAGLALGHVRVEERGPNLIISARSLAALPRAVQSEIVLTVLDRLLAPRADLGFERVEAVLELIAADGRRRTIELPGGVRAIRRGRYLCFQSDDGPRRGSGSAGLQPEEPPEINVAPDPAVRTHLAGSGPDALAPQVSADSDPAPPSSPRPEAPLVPPFIAGQEVRP
jgi:tRNA(Ile)-lysidine synthase